MQKGGYLVTWWFVLFLKPLNKKYQCCISNIPVRPLTLGSMFSSGTSTLSIIIIPVMLALSDILPSILGHSNPVTSQLQPFISFYKNDSIQDQNEIITCQAFSTFLTNNHSATGSELCPSPRDMPSLSIDLLFMTQSGDEKGK